LFAEGGVDNVKVYVLSKVAPSSVSASGSYTSPLNAFDGDFNTKWISGGFAPQWIEADLGSVHAIKKVRLMVEQTPAGATTHVISIDGTVVATLSGTFAEQSTIEADLVNAPVSGRRVRVTTTSSPSWVGWREIMIYE
jgi:hypothetical protein